jgi:hypothetical protein
MDIHKANSRNVQDIEGYLLGCVVNSQKFVNNSANCCYVLEVATNCWRMKEKDANSWKLPSVEI